MKSNPETGSSQRIWHTRRPLLCLAGLGLGLTTATVACRHPTASDVSDSTFVGTMTGLRLVAQDTSLDSAGRVRKRDSVLAHYRLTPVTLESAASRLAQNPEHAAQLLHAIDARVAQASRPAPPRPAPQVPLPAAPHSADTGRASRAPRIPAPAPKPSPHI